jgi:heat shock transcription factor
MSFPQQAYGSVNPSNDQIMRWNSNGDVPGFMDGTVPHANPYDLASFAPHQQTSNTLARRPMNALVPTNATFNAGEQWPSFLGDDGALVQQNGLPEEHVEADSIEVLEEKAQKAKREAQGKRKTIPPFVQKLSR